MGYSYGQDDTPLMCFNAYHSWQLGWYRRKSIALRSDARAVFTGELSGFVDFGSSKPSTVLIRLETRNATSYYINYNKKVGFNNGTLEGGNQVLVVAAIVGDGTGSNLVAKLGTGGSYTIRNATQTGTDVIIRVNSIVPNGNARICIGPSEGCPMQKPPILTPIIL